MPGHKETLNKQLYEQASLFLRFRAFNTRSKVADLMSEVPTDEDLETRKS